MSAYLLPCPFCGGAAEIKRPRTPLQSSIVQCSTCTVQLESSSASEDVDWNRRSDADQNELREHLDLMADDMRGICEIAGVMRRERDEARQQLVETQTAVERFAVQARLAADVATRALNERDAAREDARALRAACVCKR